MCARYQIYRLGHTQFAPTFCFVSLQHHTGQFYKKRD